MINKIINHRLRSNLRLFLLLITFSIFSLCLFLPQSTKAANVGDVTGFAWSSNIGWISASCLDTSSCAASSYGMKVDVFTGEISGQIWSSNIGWISFDRSETNSPPRAPFNTGSGQIANYNSATGQITGWARALSGCEMAVGVPVSACASSGAGAAAGGWDGWISFSGVATDGSAYGVAVSPFGDMSGWAWGGEVVGWISFSGTTGDGSLYGFKLITSDTPSVDLTATPLTIPSTPYNVDLNWDIANVTNCVASNGWSGVKDNNDGSHTELVTVNSTPTIFTLDCLDGFGNTISDSVTVTLNSIPVPVGDLIVNVPYCEIPAGSNTCTGAISWNSSDLIGDPSVRQAGSEIYDVPSGSGFATMNYGNNPFSFVDEGTNNILDNEDVSIGCVSGSSWNGTLCESSPPPLPVPGTLNIDISANPKLIRSGRVADIKVDIISDVNLNCFLIGAQSSGILFTHAGSLAVSNYTFTTRPLNSTQIVSVQCEVDGNPTYPIPDVEARINVLSNTQET